MLEILRTLKNETKDFDVLILDDCIQHRYISVGYMIMLSDFSKPFFKDFLLPLGRLRESSNNANRADCVVITKYPHSEPVSQAYQKEIKKYFSKDSVYTSSILYEEKSLNAFDTIILVTAIANYLPFENHIKTLHHNVSSFHYHDHHNFTQKEVNDIIQSYSSSTSCVIITTEKDYRRMEHNPVCAPLFKLNLDYISIQTKILFDENGTFETKIIDYVKSNKRST